MITVEKTQAVSAQSCDRLLEQLFECRSLIDASLKRASKLADVIEDDCDQDTIVEQLKLLLVGAAEQMAGAKKIVVRNE